MTTRIALIFITALCTSSSSIAQQPPYKNPALPTERRVADLLTRMTLEEKTAQLQSGHMGRPKLTDAVLNNPAKMDSLFKNGSGMMNPAFDETLEQTNRRRNALQQYLLTKTRLGIPVIFIDESHHGLVAPRADVFPHSIGFACSWDTALVEKVYNYIALQAGTRGTSLVLAPVVDVCRDPRWGRTGETFGEDPYLCGMMGSAVVKGFQGSSNGRIVPGHVAATLKHFTGHGQPEGGINQGPADYSTRTLREFHMEPFRLCIQKAMPAAVMASYADIDGVPSHANSWLLKDVLRKEWKYTGIVVSDWFGIDQLWKKHFIEPNEKAATLRAFNAGVTEDLPYGINYRHLNELVKEGKITMATLDSAVADILRLKFQLGLFEQKDIDLEKINTAAQDPAGRHLALEAAQKSMVLLKNEGGLLPIKKGQYKKIAVIGPCAATNYLGDYSGVPVHNVSLLEGIRHQFAGQSEILYAPGCMITKNGDTISQNNYQFKDKTEFPTPQENEHLIEEAVQTAQEANLVIVAIGENEQLSREAWLPDHFGDANTLDLSGAQEDLVKALVATGKPVIVYLAHGRPLSINWIAAHAPAIVDGWFTGEEAGNAFANILTGQTNPSGKLTISIPKTVGQLPVYYNHKPGAQFFEYTQGKDEPLYPFGYGLSYTTFSYSAPRLSDSIMHPNGALQLSIDITNTGAVQGDEIVQLYIHQKISSVVRPIKELKGFARISLAPGEKKTATFTINAATLSFWTAAMKYAVEPATVEIMVGGGLDKLGKINLAVKE